MSRTMRTLALAFVMVLASAVAASAHTSNTPVITCGTVTTNFQSFPAGTHAVTTYLSIDGAAAVPLAGSFTGRSGQVKAGFTPPGDGLQHTYRAQVAWTADGGGRSAIGTATLICPVAPIEPTEPPDTPGGPVPPATPPTGVAPVAPATPVGGAGGVLGDNSANCATCPCAVCTSRRVYSFLVRHTYQGQKVVGIARAFARGSEKWTTVTQTARDGQPRWRVAADFRGLVVPKGQVRTITVFLRLHAGAGKKARTVRTVQFVRLCLAFDGNPNDASAQDRKRM